MLGRRGREKIERRGRTERYRKGEREEIDEGRETNGMQSTLKVEGACF